MPRLIGKYRVSKHNRLIRTPINDSSDSRVYRLTEAAITEIIKNSVRITLKQHFLNYVGQVPPGAEQMNDLNSLIYEYNPNKHPPISLENIEWNNAQPQLKAPAFYPFGLIIDEKQYAVDMTSLLDEHLEEDNDFTVDELMST